MSGRPAVRSAALAAVAALLSGALAGAGVRRAPTDFNIRTIPSDLAAEVESAPSLLNAVGTARWALLLKVSRAVRDGGLSGIAEAGYMPLGSQREFFQAVRSSPEIPEDIRLVLEDLIIQYYFFTYYYHFQEPGEREFRGEHRAFLQALGVEYIWVEPAAQNYYQHTFLKTLVLTRPESRWGAFYRQIFDRAGFRELPREEEGEGETGAGTERPGGEPGLSIASFAAEVGEGDAFEGYFGPGFHFRLEPRPFGWEIVVRHLDREENIARLTPPFHAVPNPRELEGWHFRNSDNTGPNGPGEKNVNAPGEEREFIFSPEVGLTIQGPDSRRSPEEAEVEKVRAFGRGRLRIVDHRLGNLKPGEQAKFKWLRFEAELSWPSAFVPAGM